MTPVLGIKVYVDPAATVIGNVTLGDDASVWPGAVIRGDMHKIIIGNRSNIQDNAVLHITHVSAFNPKGWPLTVGDDVIIGGDGLDDIKSGDGKNFVTSGKADIDGDGQANLDLINQNIEDHQYLLDDEDWV